MKLIATAILVIMMGCLCGCGQMTKEQVEVQRQQLENLTRFAEDEGLGLIVLGTMRLDGGVDITHRVKWSPVTADLFVCFWNNRTQGILDKLVDALKGKIQEQNE